MSTIVNTFKVSQEQDNTTDLIQAMMNVDVTIRKVRHFHKDINVLSEASQNKGEAAMAFEGFNQHLTRHAEQIPNGCYVDMLAVRNAVSEKHPTTRELFNAAISAMGTTGTGGCFELAAHFTPSMVLGIWKRTSHRTRQ